MLCVAIVYLTDITNTVFVSFTPERESSECLLFLLDYLNAGFGPSRYIQTSTERIPKTMRNL